MGQVLCRGDTVGFKDSFKMNWAEKSHMCTASTTSCTWSLFTPCPSGRLQVLEKDLHCHKLELQIKDLTQHIEHMIQLAALQDLENIHVHKMVNLSLPAHSDPRATLHQQLALLLTIWADQKESCVVESDGSGSADEASADEVC
ncbi:hypothetical protein NHX12_005357 [Muraenolepis orangiensis]|uniref:Uncharacterized protein n=1 Tax=Muraenolepis orangiensis TaxID=630683 RepID=A0A9Q0IC01_9TELE|nr:hypothetical protein NHX12_005357 [Muraenolepis orangiensis]